MCGVCVKSWVWNWNIWCTMFVTLCWRVNKALWWHFPTYSVFLFGPIDNYSRRNCLFGPLDNLLRRNRSMCIWNRCTCFICDVYFINFCYGCCSYFIHFCWHLALVSGEHISMNRLIYSLINAGQSKI